MPASNEPPESKFAYIVVASQRARQLMFGAPPLIANPRSHKPTYLAMEELSAHQLEYQTPEPAEGASGEERKRRKA
jgi:DNA-directed RNA polymerase omega subunit